jgi:hypothetical protein
MVPGIHRKIYKYKKKEKEKKKKKEKRRKRESQSENSTQSLVRDGHTGIQFFNVEVVGRSRTTGVCEGLCHLVARVSSQTH